MPVRSHYAQRLATYLMQALRATVVARICNATVGKAFVLVASRKPAVETTCSLAAPLALKCHHCSLRNLQTRVHYLEQTVSHLRRASDLAPGLASRIEFGSECAPYFRQGTYDL
jgi:hypothetical protein